MSRVLYVRGTATAGQPLKHTAGVKYLRSSSGQKLICTDGVDYNSTASFNPNSITGLQLWLKADSSHLFTDTGGTTPVVNDGDAVKCWTDASPHAYLFTLAATNPLYKVNIVNSLPAVYWDGTKQPLAGNAASLAFLNSAAGITWFCVFRVEGVGTYTLFNAVRPGGTGNGDARFRAIAQMGSTRPTTQGRKDDGTIYTSVNGSSGTLAVSTPALLDFLVDCPNSQTTIRVGGSIVAGPTAFSAALNPIPNTNCAFVYIGAGDTVPTSPVNGYITEILAYAAVLSSGDQTLVRNYLTSKYGL